MKRYIIDIETNGLNPTKIWCVVTVDVDTQEQSCVTNVLELRIDPKALYIGHNLIGFDLPVLKRLWNVDINPRNIIDTFVCSKLFNYSAKGGHSLDEWGKRLNYPKIEHSEWDELDDFDRERERLSRVIDRCIGDCQLNRLVFLKLEKGIYSDRWKRSLRLEHEVAFICRELQETGFRFDRRRAENIHADLSKSVGQLSLDLLSAFPPREVPWPTVKNPERIRLEPFNPGSPKQVVEILNEAGWKPFEKTEGHKDCEKELQHLNREPEAHRDKERLQFLMERLRHYKSYGWKVSEENLETLPEDAPEGCRLLVKWRMLSKRLQTLDEWLRSFNADTGRIHGTFNSIGTWTHRMSHSNPNQGNVPSVNSKYHHPDLKELARTYGKDMRSCFCVDPGNTLLGVDADGIQLRILAHYMDDQRFTDALVNGDKTKGTDAHSLTAKVVDLPGVDRERGKNFIYAWILGAQIPRIAKVFGCSFDQAKEALGRIIGLYPGLIRLKEGRIAEDAARGYFEALDGRRIKADGFHMLAGYLQSGEAIIMKDACVEWKKEFKREGIEHRLVNFVHDEWQTEIRDDPFTKEFASKSQTEAIINSGRRHNLRCPLGATAKFGVDWYATH